MPRSETYLNCQLFLGPNLAETYEHVECQYKTKPYDYQFVKDTPGYVPNPLNKGRYLRIGDFTEWDQNFVALAKEGSL